MIQAQAPSRFAPGEIEHDTDDDGDIVEVFHYCTAIVYAGSYFEPPEHCEEEAGTYVPGIEEWRCGKHVAAWIDPDYEI